MELADVLHRTPREVLATVKLSEWLAYMKLANDRGDEQEARADGRGGGGGEELVDLDQPRSADEIAAMFGAKVV